VRKIDRSHTATAELALERVAVVQGSREPIVSLAQNDGRAGGTSTL
jgi:hypothetical protein